MAIQPTTVCRRKRNQEEPGTVIPPSRIGRIPPIWHLTLAMKMRHLHLIIGFIAIVAAAIPLAAQTKQNPITGQDAFADWSQEKPGVLRKISVTDLPEPKPAESVRNQPYIVPRPPNAWPIAPPGFKVTLYAGGDNGPSPSPDQQHSQQHGARSHRPKARSASRD